MISFPPIDICIIWKYRNNLLLYTYITYSVNGYRLIILYCSATVLFFLKIFEIMANLNFVGWTQDVSDIYIARIATPCIILTVYVWQMRHVPQPFNQFVYLFVVRLQFVIVAGRQLFVGPDGCGVIILTVVSLHFAILRDLYERRCTKCYYVVLWYNINFGVYNDGCPFTTTLLSLTRDTATGVDTTYRLCVWPVCKV